MPFYDYVCKECGNTEINVRRNIKENVSNMECPNCGIEMTQIFGGTSFTLKGFGWAKDNYGNKPPPEKKDTKSKVKEPKSEKKEKK